MVVNSGYIELNRDIHSVREEFGDWQTNMSLALSVCRLLESRNINPQVIIEPTCGVGNFIMAALQVFDSVEDIYGIDIHKPYLDELRNRLLHNEIADGVGIHLYNEDIFEFDFREIKHLLAGRTVLVLGNPPWVTNSQLGGMRSGNVPHKHNFRKLKGMDAITGKSNFDVAEYICREMMDLMLGENASLALLLKNSVVKNIIYSQKDSPTPVADIYQYNIDAAKEFGVSVAASLLSLSAGTDCSRHCSVYDFYSGEKITEYGWLNDCFVSNIAEYQKCSDVDGVSSMIWWSGLKHDCAKVMELTRENGIYRNGFGEMVDIEDDMLYPLLKSSDIKGYGISSVRKYVIVTQHSMSSSTDYIEQGYPKAFRYLSGHSDYMDGRSSRIYRGKPRFSIFGIGDYSFMPYKVVVSGLYKCPNFAVVGKIENKPVMVDDTCYLLGFDSLEYAEITRRVLNSEIVRTFLDSLIFLDAKRVINKDLLMRIDLLKALDKIPLSEFEGYDLDKYRDFLKSHIVPRQTTLF